MPENVLKHAIGHSRESEWNNHIFDVQKMGESIKLVGLNTMLDFSGSNVTEHEIKREKFSNERKRVPIFIDGS